MSCCSKGLAVEEIWRITGASRRVQIAEVCVCAQCRKPKGTARCHLCRRPLGVQEHCRERPLRPEEWERMVEHRPDGVGPYYFEQQLSVSGELMPEGWRPPERTR